MDVLKFCKLVLIGGCFCLALLGTFFFANAGNYRAMWGCILLVFGCLSLLDLNVSVLKGWLLTKYTSNSMTRLYLLAAIMATASAIITGLNVYLGYINRQGFRFEKDNSYAAALPTSLSMLLYSVLAFEARSHLKVIPETIQFDVVIVEDQFDTIKKPKNVF